MTPQVTIEKTSEPTSEVASFLSAHPLHKIYLCHQWHELVRDVFGHATEFLVARNQSGIGALVPVTIVNSRLFGRMGISLPFINYGGIISRDESCLSALLSHLEVYRSEQELKFLELRMDYPIDTSHPCRQHKVTFHLELPGETETLLRSFKAKLRSQIRRPAKEGMYARVGGVELLDVFYKAFSLNMRDLGTPVLPPYFFKSILEKFPDDAYIAAVFTKENRVAAAAFLIKYGSTMEIPWASSIREYNRYSPNMLLYWRSLELAIDLGCQIFDFGRCTPGEGTYRFKKQWGAIEKKLYWYYVLPEHQSLPEINPKNPKLRAFVKTWQHLPLFITNYLGPKIIRHIP